MAIERHGRDELRLRQSADAVNRRSSRIRNQFRIKCLSRSAGSFVDRRPRTEQGNRSTASRDRPTGCCCMRTPTSTLDSLRVTLAPGSSPTLALSCADKLLWFFADQILAERELAIAYPCLHCRGGLSLFLAYLALAIDENPPGSNPEPSPIQAPIVASDAVRGHGRRCLSKGLRRPTLGRLQRPPPVPEQAMRLRFR